MATCVIALVVDSDTGREAPACNVHCTYNLPCAHDGEPAATEPMHTHSLPSRIDAVEFWRKRTLGQRTLVIHRGSLGDGGHLTGNSITCWCRPETITGVDLANRCRACTCDPVLCETDESGSSCLDCGSCLHGCPLDVCPAHPDVR